MRYLLAALMAAVGLAAAQEVTPQRGVSFNATGILPSHTHESASQGGSALRFVSFIRVGSSALGPVIQSTQTHTNLGNSSYTGANGFDNRYATVVGGVSNSARGEKSFIGGGGDNETVTPTGLGEGDLATIGGGAGNRAGYGATVGGGGNAYGLVGNRALGDWSTIPGGLKNLASGAYSFAAGRQSSATAAGAWALSDSQAADFVNATANSYAARFAGGYTLQGGNLGLGIGIPSTLKLHIYGASVYGEQLRVDASAGSVGLGVQAGGASYCGGIYVGTALAGTFCNGGLRIGSSVVNPPADTLIVDKLGVGTASPGNPFHVSGDTSGNVAWFESKLANSATVYIQAADGAGYIGTNGAATFALRTNTVDRVIVPNAAVTTGGALCLNASKVLSKCTTAPDASGNCTCP